MQVCLLWGFQRSGGVCLQTPMPRVWVRDGLGSKKCGSTLEFWLFCKFECVILCIFESCRRMCCLKTTPPPLPSLSHAHSWVRLSLVCLLLVYMLQDSETVTDFGWWRGGPCNWTHLSLLSRFLFHSLTQNTQYSSLCLTAGR